MPVNAAGLPASRSPRTQTGSRCRAADRPPVVGGTPRGDGGRVPSRNGTSPEGRADHLAESIVLVHEVAQRPLRSLAHLRGADPIRASPRVQPSGGRSGCRRGSARGARRHGELGATPLGLRSGPHRPRAKREGRRSARSANTSARAASDVPKTTLTVTDAKGPPWRYADWTRISSISSRAVAAAE